MVPVRAGQRPRPFLVRRLPLKARTVAPVKRRDKAVLVTPFGSKRPPGLDRTGSVFVQCASRIAVPTLGPRPRSDMEGSGLSGSLPSAFLEPSGRPVGGSSTLGPLDPVLAL